MQHRIIFFGGKKNGEEALIDDSELQDEYRVCLDEPKTTPCLRTPKPNELGRFGRYFLRELWRNGRFSHYKYVYQDDVERFNAKYGQGY